jgi:hypothetical protein
MVRCRPTCDGLALSLNPCTVLITRQDGLLELGFRDDRDGLFAAFSFLFPPS